MSAKASAYVTPLVGCPDGAALTCAMKCILFCLADHHNPSLGLCAPGLSLLARESLMSRRNVQYLLAYLEEHLVLSINRPPRQGRGNVTTYTLLAIDAPGYLAELLLQRDEGVHHDPLSAPPSNGKGATYDEKGCNPCTLSAVPHDEKGATESAERVQEGCNPRHRYKERTSNQVLGISTNTSSSSKPYSATHLKPLLLLLLSNYKSATYEAARLLFHKMRGVVPTISVDDAVALVFAMTEDIALRSDIRNPIGLILTWAETIAHDDIAPARSRWERAQRAALERKEAEETRAALWREYEAWQDEWVVAHPGATSIPLAEIPAKFHPILGEIAAQRESEEGEQGP